MNETLDIRPQDAHNEVLIANVHPSDWINPEPSARYNLVVLGAGTAGLVAAVGAAGLGARVALVERYLMGGDCLNVGCVPSKAVIRSSRVLGELARAPELGVRIPPGTDVDFGRVMERMRRLRARISANDSARRYRDMGVDVFLGEGRFSGPGEVEVDGRRLRFTRAVIATGGRPVEPAVEGLAEAGYLTNETVFSLTERPGHLAIFGAGPIGCEMAQAFRRLGSEVTLFHKHPRILNREDADAAELLGRRFSEEGIAMELGSSIRRVSRENGKKVIHFSANGRADAVAVDEILVGIGRAPNVEGLNLESAGVDFDFRRGVTVNDRLQTTNPRIYAAGDVCMTHRFTHMADAAARIVIQNALFLGRKKLSALTVPWSTYTDPEIAHVGMYEEEARQRGIDVATFLSPMSEVDRAITDGEEEGFIKIHATRKGGRILGATIVAPHAGDLISEVTLAMVGGIALPTLASAIHPYPTQAEGIRKAAEAYNRTRLTPLVKRLFSAWLSWRR